MNKISLKGGLEYDILTGWRRVLCYAQKPGICKYVKRKYRKRFRQREKELCRSKLREL